MKSSLRTRSSRAFAVGAVSVALAASGATAAFAVDPVVPNTNSTANSSANPNSNSTTGTSSDTGSLVTDPGKALAAAIVIRADRTQVKSGQVVTFSGTTRGLKIGSTVVLQHHNGTKWVNMPEHTLVKQGSTYILAFKPTFKGKQLYRVSVGRTMSLPVTITVM